MPLKPLFHFFLVQAVAFDRAKVQNTDTQNLPPTPAITPALPSLRALLHWEYFFISFFFSRSHVSVPPLVFQISIHPLLESYFIFHLCNEEADLVLTLVKNMEIVETVQVLNECHRTQQEILV